MTTASALSRQELLDLVRAAAAVVCGREERGIAADSVLADLGIDSLGRVCLAEIVEEQLSPKASGLRIPDGELTDFVTVDDVAAYLQAQL